MGQLSITYSLADQNFAETLSIGILNLSVQMGNVLARRPEVGRMHVLSNSTLNDRLELPPNVPVSIHDSAISGTLGRFKWDQWRVYSEAAKLRNNWLFLPKGYAPFTRPCPVNMVPCMADANYDYYKRTYPSAIPFLKRGYYDLSVRSTIKYARIIFTISDYSTSEVLRIAKGYGLVAPPTSTIGIGFHRPKEIYKDRQQRVLVLAGRWPHKRTDLALKYLAEWQNRSDFHGTVEWVGKLPPGLSLPAFPRWIMHPRLDDPTFKRLKGEALALVYFSDYEGFGMPPVEAALVGTCPVYSDLPVTREVMAGAGYSFDNKSYQSFEVALNKALTVPREQVFAWGEDLLRRHNWDLVVDRVVRGLTEAEKM